MNVYAFEERGNPKTISPIFLFLILLVLIPICFRGNLRAQETIAQGDVTVKGVTLGVNPAQLTVPVHTPTNINTVFSMDTEQLIRGMVVKGELRGPGLSKPMVLTTLPNHPFSIPGLSMKGEYYLENIRLERDGKMLLKAVPESVLIQAIDMVVTYVESRPLTLSEIREKGINITDDNFTVFNFSIGLVLESKEVRYDIPVVYRGSGEPYIPPMQTSVYNDNTLGSYLPMSKSNIAFPMKSKSLDLNASLSGEDLGTGGASIPGLLIFNNDIAFLNQFFSVMFIISNNAPDGSNLSLSNLTAEITYPDGLREADTTPPHITGTPIPIRCPGPDNKIGTPDDVDIVLATFSGMAEFLAEGLKEGTHTVTVNFKGTLSGLPSGDTEIEGTASGAVVVRNPEFSVIFSHPEIVRVGEEYDIFMTLTNTSSVPANLVSLTMPASRLYGTELLTEETPETVSFDTLEPGRSETVRFRMLSKQTGQVRATAFQAEGSVTGRFILTAGVGEHGIPLSPDTLVLPAYAYYLSDASIVLENNALLGKNILNTAIVALGEAYSIATTPPGGLPEGLPYVNGNAVKARVNEIAEAGQRVQLGDTFLKSIEVLTLDWLGNRYTDLSYDMLRRLTTKGTKSAAALSAVYNQVLSGTTPAAFQESFAQTCSYKEPYYFAQLSFSSGQRTADMVISDYYGNRLTGNGDEPMREVPFGEIYMLDAGGQGPVDMALVGHFDENKDALYTAEISGQAEGSFDLSLIVPGITGGFRMVTFSGVTCSEGSRSLVTVKGKENNYALVIDLDGNGIEDTDPSYTDVAISEPQLELIGAVQDCRADDAGHAVALLFNRSISETTAKDKNNFFVAGKNVYASFLQPSERIVLVGLDNPVSPFVQSYILVENLEDTNGGAMVPLPEEGMPITSTIKTPGGIVYGRVFTAEGRPVANARVLLQEHEDDENPPTNSYTRTDAFGNYQFDYVRILPPYFQIIVIDPDTNRVEKVYGKLRVQAQRLQMDIFMMGRGTITGRVLTGAGLPAAYAIVYASPTDTSSLENFGVRCDSEGRFVLSDVPLGGLYLRAEYESQSAYVSTAITAPGETRDVTITLADIQTGTVQGQVLFSGGVDPVETASINLYRNGLPLGFWGKTDKEGSFKFQNVSVGPVVIHCYDPRTGKSAGIVTGEVTAGQTFSSVIIFRGNGSISGIVRSYDHIGMEGIIVFIAGSQFLTTTGPGGAFSFADVPMGNYMVAAYNESTGEQISTSVELKYENDDVPVFLTFPEPVVSGLISGTVTGASGLPAADVTVTLSDGNFYNLDTIRAANGSFTFADLRPGRYVLWVKAPTPAGTEEAGITSATVYSGIQTNAAVQLVGMGDINVNVYANDGVTRVMADVDVTTRKFKVEEGDYIGFTNGESHYTSSLSGPLQISRVYCGPYTAKARNAFYPNGITGGGTLAAAGDVSTVDLLMEALGTVDVTVVSYDGQTLVGGAELAFSRAGLTVPVEVTAGADGKYQFTLVPAGGFTIEAKDEQNGYVGQVYGNMGKEGGNVAVEIRLKGRAAVTGTVKNTSGTPVPNASVTLRNTSYPYETFETIHSSSEEQHEGQFTFYAVSEGDFVVEVLDEATGLGGRATGTIEGHGQDVTGFEVILEPSGSVTGRVLQPDGETLTPQARVILWKSGLTFGYVAVGSDGTFRFDYLPMGNYSLSAYEPATGRDGSCSFSVQTDGETVAADIRLKGRGTVMGTVFDGSGVTPVANAQVTLKRTGSPDIQTSADADGNFKFEYIAEGAFTLYAFEDSTQLWGEAKGEIEYDEQNVTVNVFLKGTGTISGTVYEPDGTTTVGGALIKLDGLIDKTVYSDSEDGTYGTYSITNVPVGSFTITVSKTGRKDKGTSSGTIDYHGQEKTIDLTFQGTGTVSGTVTQNGTGIDGIVVRLTSGYDSDTRTTSGGGNFSFNPVLGTFSIEAVHQSDTSLSATAAGVLETPGQSVSLTLELGASGIVQGTVKKADGETAADGAYVTLHGTSQSGNYTLYTTAGADGHFQFNAVRLGSFYLEFLDRLADGRQKYTNGTITQAGDNIDVGTLTLDNISPAVTVITPANGTVGITYDPGNPAVAIVIQFSEDIDPNSLSGIRLLENGTAVVPSVTHNTNTVTLTAPVNSFKLYTISIDGTVKDAAGNPLAAAVTSTFTTVDREGPVVAAFDPPDGTAGVSPTAVITVTFNEPVGTTGVTLLKDGVTLVSGTLLYAANKISASFTPDAPLTTDSTYTVTVQNSTDICGNTQTQVFSSSFTTIDTIAPTLQLTAPAGTSVIEGGSGTVSADTGGAADVAQVFFFINGQFSGSLVAAPYNYSFTAPLINQSGDTFLVEAYALDNAGNQSNRANLQFTLTGDNPPQLSISGPTDPSIYPGHSVNVSLSASDDLALKTITFTAAELSINDTQTITGKQFSKTYTLNIPNDMPPGSTVMLTAEVMDSRDQLATAASLTLHVPQDQELPVVTLTAPTPGQQFNYNDTFTIQADVSDDVGLDTVTFYKDNEILQSFDKPAVDSVLETTYHVLNANEELEVVLKAVAVDLVGKQSENQVTVTFKKLIDETLPAVKIISPTNGSLVFPGENLTLKVEISNDVENSIQQVTFRKDGTDLQVVDIPQYTGTTCSAEIPVTIPTDAVIGSYITFEMDALHVTENIGSSQSIVGVVTGDFLDDGTVIAAGDTSHDTHIIIIRDGTVTINGDHNFVHVLVKETGILTHTGAGETEEYKMDLTLTGKLVVGLEAKLDVSSRGYLGGHQVGNNSDFGRTLGNVNTGGSNFKAGGSYGGYGGRINDAQLNEMYGSITDPVNPGSGGGGYSSYKGGNGGGVVLINAPEVIVDGGIYSNGGNSGAYASAGSGGSIRIDTNTLKGSGEIKGNGGNSSSNDSTGGGGGRIALIYQDASAFDLSKIVAYGGTFIDGIDSTRNASAGTVYLKKQGETGQLIIDNRAQQSYRPAVFPLLEPAESTSVSGNVLEDLNAAYMSGSLVGMKLMPNIEEPQTTFTITANDSTSITVDGTITNAGGGEMYSIVMVFDEHLIITNTPVLLNREVELGQLTVRSNGTITHPDSTTASTSYLSLSTGTLTIESGSSIDVSERGYLGANQGINSTPYYGRTLGNVNGSYLYSAASYGGLGAKNTSYAVNDVYGSPYNPVFPGSGGGAAGGYIGGNGGGVVRIIASTIQLDGSIKSNGGSVTSYRGAGSGGSIRIDVTTINGSGEIQANGGSCSSSASSSGGGGRIALYYQDASQFDLSKIFAYGGIYTSGTDSTRNGSAGTVYLEIPGQRGQLIVDNNSTETSSGTPLIIASPGTISDLSAYTLTDEGASFVPGNLVGMLLQPNINRTETYTIIANTETVIEVEHTADLTTVAAVGDQYRVKHGANLVLEDSMLQIAGDVTLLDITLNNAQLMMDGTLTVDNLILQGGSTVTHPTATTNTTYSLRIEADEIVIDEGSSIDVTARGFLGGGSGDNSSSNYGRTLGNVDGSYYYSGAGYGGYSGLGYYYGTTYKFNDIYGSLSDPVDPGSGGGGSSTAAHGGNGGGVIRIIAPLLQLNGSIISDGGATDIYAGGGSGGSIRIDVTTLKGIGSIRAHGGNSNKMAAGGGGRIAVYYTDASEFDLDAVTAYGGANTYYSDTVRNGSAGTVYLKQEGETPLLIIDNNGKDSYKPLVFPVIKPATAALVSGNVLTGPSDAGYMPGSLVGMKLIPNTDNPETFFTITANDATSITVDGDLTGTTEPGDTYRGNMVFGGSLKINNTNAVIDRDLEVGELIITGNASVKHSGASITSVGYLSITADSVTIDSGSSIDVTEKGYLGGNREDNTTNYGLTLGNVNGSSIYCGAGYGGLGGQYGTYTFNNVYGSLYFPTDPGSGGGGSSGGNGGGVLRLTTSELQLNGNIASNGGSVNHWAGAGSGGSIQIHTGTLSGSGTITANGGNSLYAGAGGGGRIAVYYETLSGFDLTNITAYGGIHTNSSVANQNGGAGTVFLKLSTETSGDLLVDNNNTITRADMDTTPLPAVGQGNNTSLDTAVMVNSGASFIPGALAGIKLNPNTLGSDVFTIISNTGTEIFTDPSEGNLTDYGVQYSAYIGEHSLRNLTVTGLAKVTTTDKIQVSGTMVVDAGAALTAENIQ